MPEAKLCSIPNCGKPHVARGWCSMHYQRWKFYGDPTVTIIAGNGTNNRWIDEIAVPYAGDDCLYWPFGKKSDERPSIRINGKTQKVSRIVCERAHGSPPTKSHETAHSCGDGQCLNPRHLRWATHVENEADKLLHGTLTRGGRNHHCKLTEQDVREIRSLYGFLHQKELGERFGVNFTTIAAIVTRRSWSWLD